MAGKLKFALTGEPYRAQQVITPLDTARPDGTASKRIPYEKPLLYLELEEVRGYVEVQEEMAAFGPTRVFWDGEQVVEAVNPTGDKWVPSWENSWPAVEIDQ